MLLQAWFRISRGALDADDETRHSMTIARSKSRWQIFKRDRSKIVNPTIYGASHTCYLTLVVDLEELVGAEWAEWYRLTPAQRWLVSENLWQTYLALGGSLDPEPDTESPFYDPQAPRSGAAHGRAGVRVSRGGRAKS